MHTVNRPMWSVVSSLSHALGTDDIPVVAVPRGQSTPRAHQHLLGHAAVIPKRIIAIARGEPMQVEQYEQVARCCFADEHMQHVHVVQVVEPRIIL